MPLDSASGRPRSDVKTLGFSTGVAEIAISDGQRIAEISTDAARGARGMRWQQTRRGGAAAKRVGVKRPGRLL